MATLNKNKQLTNEFWTANAHGQIKCPVPGCNHVAEVITKAHCRIVHGMEREDVKKAYGMPTIVERKGAILSENNGRKWYSIDTGLGVL